MSNSTIMMETEEEEKAIENIKLVASLVDWNSYDAQMGKLFYHKFGKLLEKKLAEYEEAKKEMKECVRQACGMKAMRTPRKKKPTAALQEQIRQFQAMNFESDDEQQTVVPLNVGDPAAAVPDVEMTEQQSPLPVPAATQSTHTAREPSTTKIQSTGAVHTVPVFDVAMAEQQQSSPPIPATVVMAEQQSSPPLPATPSMHTATKPSTPNIPSTPATPVMKKPKYGTPYHKTIRPLQSSSSMKKLAINKADKADKAIKLLPFIDYGNQQTSSKASPMKSPKCTPGRQALNTTIQKQAKLKELDAKAARAEKIRQEQLNEKKERAKREQEERARRVEQNKQKKEQERLEREEKARLEQAKIREFVDQQRQEQQRQKAMTASPRKPGTNKKTAATAKKDVVRVEEVLVKEVSPKKSVEESELEEVSVYEMTKEKIPIPSTEDNYNVDDLSSGDETDNDSRPRKTVPKWANKENVQKHSEGLRRLLTIDQITQHFGRILQPTLNELLKGSDNPKKYPSRRPSSAMWDSPMSDPTPGVGRFQKNFHAKQ